MFTMFFFKHAVILREKTKKKCAMNTSSAKTHQRYVFVVKTSRRFKIALENHMVCHVKKSCTVLHQT